MTKPWSSRWAVPALAAISVLVVLARNTQGLAELLVDTLSPAETMALGDEAQNLANAFPSGAELTAISAPLRLYALFDAFGLGVVGATQWMIALEAFALFAGIYAAVRILHPTTTALVAGASATVATVGYALYGHNLANFGFLYGWNYGFAAAAAAVALAYALHRRWTASACTIVLVALIHSVIAVLVVLTVAPLAVIDIVRRRFALRWRPLALVAIPAAVYLLASRGDVQLPTGQLDIEAYVARVRAFQSHYFFEFSTTFLRTFAEDIASWLIAVVLVLAAGMTVRRLGDESLARRTAAVVATIGTLAALGWAHSNLDQPNVTLLVLTLHRSSTFINLLLLSLVVPLLFDRGPGRRPVTAAAVVVWCLLPNPVDHARWGAIVLMLAIVWVVSEVKHQPDRRSIVTSVAVVPLVSVAGYFLIVSPGLAGGGWSPLVSALRRDGGLLLAGAGIVGLAAFTRRRTGRGDRDHRAREQGAAVVVVIAWAVVMLLGRAVADNPRAFTGTAQEQRADLIDVALWAREETPADAVFLLPLRDDGFGWRTFAERATSGRPREWLHYAFLYSRDQRVMDEGTRRAGLLGIDVDSWLEAHPQLGVGGQLVAEISERFVQMTDAQAAQYAAELGARFVVVETATGADRAAPCFRTVHSNATYLVLEVQPDCLKS